MDNKLWVNSGQLLSPVEKNATAIALKTELDLIMIRRMEEEEEFYRVSKMIKAAHYNLRYGLAKILRKVALILPAIEQAYQISPIVYELSPLIFYDMLTNMRLIYESFIYTIKQSGICVRFTIPVKPQGDAQNKEFIAADVRMKVGPLWQIDYCYRITLKLPMSKQTRKRSQDKMEAGKGR
ncbi:hypothetical protein BDZ91DRAFT_783097 [Kalaharituber pfeilii]|nr:hypothetical protein BDZ91DRAFT_783097 [Kalaharituber pfeilii]